MADITTTSSTPSLDRDIIPRLSDLKVQSVALRAEGLEQVRFFSHLTLTFRFQRELIPTRKNSSKLGSSLT